MSARDDQEFEAGREDARAARYGIVDAPGTVYDGMQLPDPELVLDAGVRIFDQHLKADGTFHDPTKMIPRALSGRREWERAVLGEFLDNPPLHAGADFADYLHHLCNAMIAARTEPLKPVDSDALLNLGDD